MAIKERKQITGTEAQIKAFAGHEGVLAYATDTKRLHVLSGTAGQTTELANKGDIPPAVDISGKADKTYVDESIPTLTISGKKSGKLVDINRTSKAGFVLMSSEGESKDIRFSLPTTDGVNPLRDIKLVNNVPSLDPSIPEELGQYTTFVVTSDEKEFFRGLTVEGGVSKYGDRGALGGYEEAFDEIQPENEYNLTQDSPDVCFRGTGGVTVKNGPEGKAYTKIVYTTGGGATLESAWNWVSAKAPEIKTDGMFVFHWNNDRGIANYIPRMA